MPHEGAQKRLFGLVVFGAAALIAVGLLRGVVGRIPEKEAFTPVHPPPGLFDPNPSTRHETLGEVVPAIHPAIHDNRLFRRISTRYAGGTEPAPVWRRLRHPTIVEQLVRDTVRHPVYRVSIDGSNEARPGNCATWHTTEGRGVTPLAPHRSILMRVVGGTLSDGSGFRPDYRSGYDDAGFPLYGPGGERYRASRRNPPAGGERFAYFHSDGHSLSALFVRLRSASGKTTPPRKFCQAGACGDAMTINNPFDEPAHLDFRFNLPEFWLSHWENTPAPKLVCGSKYAGLNGDRLVLELRFY